MKDLAARAICWIPLWNKTRPNLGLEQVLLSGRCARGAVLTFQEDGQPYCLRYQLGWDPRGLIRTADVQTDSLRGARAISLRADGNGQWHDAGGEYLPHLEGCQDLDIAGTPFTNSFPIWRSQLAVGERREYHMAWLSAPELVIQSQPQAYTRVGDHQYRFEVLDGSGFHADITVDDDGLVTEYPGYFARVPLLC